MEVVRNREIMPKAARPEHKQAKPTSHFNTIRQFHRMPGRKVAAGSEERGVRWGKRGWRGKEVSGAEASQPFNPNAFQLNISPVQACM